MSKCNRSTKAVFAFSLFLVVPLVVGCDSGAVSDGFTGARGQVSGTVTLDDQPLQKGCQVLFMAAKGGYTAAGAVEDGGRYTLVYDGSSKGLPVGDYMVQVSPPVDTSSENTAQDPAAMAAKMQLGADAGAAEDTGPVPAKYKSTSTSELTFTVKEGQNTADLKLTK